jgi:urease accessory protein UreH
VGREARLELVFEQRRGRTIVAHAYVEPPFRIGQSFAIDDAAYVIIVCSGPGIFAGDTLRQSVRVERGARAVLTSQSALQVHPPQVRLKLDATCEDVATINHSYHVDEDAELHCHWDPVIPFADSSLVQQFDLDIETGSRLYWSDALMSGRASRGEAWRFRELAHELRLRVGGSTKYLERYRLTPGERDVTRPWIAGDAQYFATTLVHHPGVTAEHVEALHRDLAAARLKPRAPSDEPRAPGDARVAIDRLDSSLMVARVMSAGGAAFATARAAIRGAVLDTIFHRPQLAGRK